MTDVSKRDQALREIVGSRGRTALTEEAAKRVLHTYGIPVPRSVVVQTSAEVPEATTGLNAPFVVKLMSQQVLHKSDLGAVRVNIPDALGAARAVDEIAAIAEHAGATVDGFLVEEMAPAGHELIIGGFRDEQLGPAVLLGLGGVFVEAIRDTSIRICPISRSDALSMISELQASRIFSGFRGQPGISVEAVVDTLLKLGGPDGILMELSDHVAEIDLNPVIANDTGAVSVDARFVLIDAHHGSRQPASRPAREGTDFSPLFAPRTIAIVGMSTKRSASGNRFLAALRAGGFAGHVYAIHPTADTVDGVPAFRSVQDVPEVIDYCYVGIPAAEVPAFIDGAEGRIRFAQVLASGFAETADGIELQEQLRAAARSSGVRIIGPNCLGTYSPRGLLSFVQDVPMTPGSVGILSQSGGLSVDTIRLGANRGIRFSGVVSLGNCADVDVPEVLEFYFQDPGTKVIGIYIESIKDGRRLFHHLAKYGASKPVVLLKGGTGEDGVRAAASHTGALAGDHRIWQAMARQTGCVLVRNLHEFVNTLLAFQCLKPREGRPTWQVVMFGNGGGASVLGTDALSRGGLRVSALPPTTVDALKGLNLPPGVSLQNPVDLPVGALTKDEGQVARDVLEIVERSKAADAIVMHFNLGVITASRRNVQDALAEGSNSVVQRLVEAASEVKPGIGETGHRALVLLSDGSIPVETARQRYRGIAVENGVPVFDRFDDAVEALSNVSVYERFLFGRQGSASDTA